MMKLAYFGLKQPKVVEAIVNEGTADEKTEKFTFFPFKETEVPDEIGKMLLRCAGDVFKRTDVDERKPRQPIKVATDGYVGDAHASQIPDLERVKKAETKAEEGKTIDEVIAEDKKQAKSEGKLVVPSAKIPGGRAKRILANAK